MRSAGSHAKLAQAMELRRLGPLDREVPVVGQGTWHLDESNRRTAIATLRHGIDLGMTHVDTAEMYGDGIVQEIVGEALRGLRHQVFLVDKVLPDHATRQGTIAACERALARLQTDYIDCYLLHWRGSIPLAETFAGMEDLRRAGKILSWGVSNFDEDDLREALRIADEGRIACNQVLYHIQVRAIEHEVMPMCQRHGIAVVAYSPLGHGDFPDPETPRGQLLEEIAAAHNATARQVALRFLIQMGAFTIPKASTPEHAAENAGAGTFHLTEEQMALIDGAFPRGRKPSTLPML